MKIITSQVFVKLVLCILCAGFVVTGCLIFVRPERATPINVLVGVLSVAFGVAGIVGTLRSKGIGPVADLFD